MTIEEFQKEIALFCGMRVFIDPGTDYREEAKKYGARIAPGFDKKFDWDMFFHSFALPPISEVIFFMETKELPTPEDAKKAVDFAKAVGII